MAKTRTRLLLVIPNGSNQTPTFKLPMSTTQVMVMTPTTTGTSSLEVSFDGGAIFFTITSGIGANVGFTSDAFQMAITKDSIFKVVTSANQVENKTIGILYTTDNELTYG